MSEPTVDELRAARQRDEAETHALEKQLDVLDPAGAPYARQLGIERPARRDYTAEGDAAYAAEFVARRRDWLLGRYQEHAARAARYEQAAANGAAGIDRFAGDSDDHYHLDELLEPERQRRNAIWDAAGLRGGLQRNEAS